MAFWINICGCQSCPRMTICVVNQLKNDSYCQGLYKDFYQALFLVFNMTDIDIQLLENCLETDMKLQYSMKLIQKECNIGIFYYFHFYNNMVVTQLVCRQLNIPFCPNFTQKKLLRLPHYKQVTLSHVPAKAILFQLQVPIQYLKCTRPSSFGQSKLFQNKLPTY